jgi:hypothetical protein
MRRWGLVFVLALAGGASPASPEECSAPCIDYAISAELQDDWIFSSNPSLFESNDLQPTYETNIALKPFDHFAFVVHTTTEDVLDKLPGENRAFEDIGSYVEEIYARFDFEPVRIRAGKFNPIFGLATDVLDGISATDLVGNYDNDERWGGEARVDFEAFGLNRSLTLSAFTTDRTVLSESLFTNRGRLRLSDGGAGNADGIGSFVALLDACKGAETKECFAEGDFGYRLGFRYQDSGHATAEQIEEEIRPRDELGFLAAATARHAFSEDMILRAVAEVAYLDHFDGTPDDAFVATGSIALEMAPMTYMATYSRQSNLIAGGADTTDQLFDFTAVYDFGEDRSLAGESWKLGAGYSYLDLGDGESTHKLSVVLTVDLEGSIGGRGKATD